MNNESFLGLLAESPFAGLQEHMSVGDDAVSKLGDFVVAISEEDWRTAEECREEEVVVGLRPGLGGPVSKQVTPPWP